MATGKRPKGRPTSLTPEVANVILTAVRAGNYLDDAAAYANVSVRVVFLWLERGRLADEAEDPESVSEFDRRCMHFFHDVQTARAQATVHALSVIQRASETQWQAAAWYLERTNPRKWGRHETVALTGEDGGPVQVEHRSSLLEKLSAMRERAGQVIDATEVKSGDEGLRAIG